MDLRVLYGQRKLCLTVPDERLVGVLKPRAAATVKDVDARVRERLAAPLDAAPLAELARGRRSALLVTVNGTRPSPAPLLHPVLDVLEAAGVASTLIIANGRHALMDDESLQRHLGERLTSCCRVLQHDAFNSEFRELGVTQLGTPIRVNAEVFRHDLVIGSGIIEPSYLMGWSGGRKLMLPGLAHHEAVDNNHFHLTHPDTRIGRLKGNPLSDDAAEFAARCPFHFIVYAVSGPNDEVVDVVAGDPVQAHERGCAAAAEIYRVPHRQADIVISSAGGHPYDCNLVQGKKAIIPAIDAVARRGAIILCAECPEGLGAEDTFVRWLREKSPAQVVRDVRQRELFSLGAHGANILARPIVEKNATVILVTSGPVARQLQDTYLTVMTNLDAAWNQANQLTGPQSRVLVVEKARRLIVDRAL